MAEINADNLLYRLLKLKAEDYINGYIGTLEAPEPLLSAMKYALEGGGKRIRPVLTLLGARIGGGKEDDALPFALAVELVHTYSLIHDDLPCMDDDDMRRGRPTVHKKFGEAVAVLTGDALLNAAFEVLAAELLKDASAPRTEAFALLAECAGMKGMIKGQIMDISTYPYPLEEINMGKTCALIRCALLMGAKVGGASEVLQESLKVYADNLGMAFQIADDILDYEAGERSDINYVEVNGMKKAARAVAYHTAKAKEAVMPYGRREELIGLADYLMNRKN